MTCCKMLLFFPHADAQQHKVFLSKLHRCSTQLRATAYLHKIALSEWVPEN